MEIKKVGVVGCGLMGSGIVQVCAQSGYKTLVSETNDELLSNGVGLIQSNLSKSVKKGNLAKQDEEAILARIKGTTTIGDFADCDLVIEAATEKIELKKQVFANLDNICPKHTILASNTSCLSIMEMASVTQRPSQVLGLHFFNPVPAMKLLEIVKTIATSDKTLEIGKNFGKSVGKTIVIVQDAPGFIVNRLMVPQLLNAIRMLESGIATKEDIDTGMKLGLNHPVGPLALSDLIGLDTLHFIASGIYEQSKDPQYVSPTLLVKMVTAGWFGRKTGKGFYEYTKVTANQ